MSSLPLRAGQTPRTCIPWRSRTAWQRPSPVGAFWGKDSIDRPIFTITGLTEPLVRADSSAIRFLAIRSDMPEWRTNENRRHLCRGAPAEMGSGAAALTAAPYVSAAVPYAVTGGADLLLGYGLGAELKAGFNGQCRW